MKPQSIIVDKKEKGLVYYCYNILTKKVYIYIYIYIYTLYIHCNKTKVIIY